MRKASIVSIGNELLNGQAVDTNAVYLSEKLLALGIPVVSRHTVPDGIDAIVRAFDLAQHDADLIIATGGLGPTDDDLTRRALAECLGADLKCDDRVLRQIRDFFARPGLQMPERNKVQAYIPVGGKPLENKLGTAPGIEAEKADKWFFSLPGVPLEMKDMFEQCVLPELARIPSGHVTLVRKIKCFGAGESAIAELLGNLMQRNRNPLINCTVSCGVITLSIVASADNRADANTMIEHAEQLLNSKLGTLVYGVENQSLSEVVGQMLAEQNKTLATAESCTGGLIEKLLTDIGGSSRYFTYGWVTYSNDAKSTQLDINPDLIRKYGAVSENVAAAMANAARIRAKADFALTTSGIAGPDGATAQKPVGLVYISICSEKGCKTRRFIFSHDRDSIRRRAALTAINLLRLELSN